MAGTSFDKRIVLTVEEAQERLADLRAKVVAATRPDGPLVSEMKAFVLDVRGKFETTVDLAGATDRVMYETRYFSVELTISIPGKPAPRDRMIGALDELSIALDRATPKPTFV